MKNELRSGYTTGACAAAAAKGAAQMLLTQASVSEVSIDLPAGVCVTFQVHGQTFSESSASCFVVKDAGDDPDVTNGAEVWATVERQGARLVIEGGIGIGKATKPGLAIPPGEWAINPVPRQMIQQSVGTVLSEFNIQHSTFKIIISIPDGEERAKKTLNARLGIIGGLSILGTTGIVRPISAKAWTDTIEASLDVAKACGCPTVVLSTGRSSEMAAQEFFRVKEGSRADYSNLPLAPSLPEESYIMMGDHVAYALRACAAHGFIEPIIACQFAKLLKIACGYENTHAAASELDLSVLRGWAEAAQVSPEHLAIISSANTAREIAVATGFDSVLMELVAVRASQAATVHAPGIQAQPLLCGYNGNVVV
ncbi:MAG: cobalamin biosynthesis protein CbiD [Geobacteraceae bacterium]|nr:cobalamin biosynthesis protein CbiD [Geobacteraceae bacterium]NTW80125.1 cobalamin biosynthesis protein CbiD [Geobacteraceae bacterium]